MDGQSLLATPFKEIIIKEIRGHSSDVKSLVLTHTDGSAITYKAGQFITFSFVNSGREDRRSYSFSSAPSTGDEPTITVKRVENGAHSRGLIDRAKVGDTLMSTGAAGLFTIPESILNYSEVLFFAAGIGITPVYSLIRELLFSAYPGRIVLFYSSKSEIETTFYQELQSLEKAHPHQFHIEWRFSNAKNLLKARISKVVFPDLLKKYQSVPQQDVLCYICGPEDYRWLVHLLLIENGIPVENIRREIFMTGRMPVPSLPPDLAAHHVFIKLAGKEHKVLVQYPETIMSAAKKEGIVLPYSCMAGRCASCICRCTNGEVWMAYNEVLTLKDQQAGLVLTCTTYPVHGDVWLEFP